MTFVVEPVVTIEKLHTLLAEQCEQSALDFKRTLNLGKGHTADIVELAKDVAAMRSESNGGYIVIGADDNGTPVGDLTPSLAKLFDEATLRPKLEKYLVDADVRTAQHEIHGHILVLIYIAPASHGWCIFRAPGEYEDANGKRQYVFRVGDVFVRHGTSSERWIDADRERLVRQIVDRRKGIWRKELTEEFTIQLKAANSVRNLVDSPAVAVSWNIDETDFENLVIELFRRNDGIPLRRLLLHMPRDAADLVDTDTESLAVLLDRLTTFIALTIQYERDLWTEPAIVALEKIYALGFESPVETVKTVSLWLDVITRVYGLGSLAVRLEAWQKVRLLADRRPWRLGPMAPTQGSWLRHALTMAARANMLAEQGADLLARSHNTVRSITALHPDRPAEHSAILDSLCQFDVCAAVAVIGARGKFSTSNYYPNFARYEWQRSAPAFTTLVTQRGIRAAVFGHGDDTSLAQALYNISDFAEKEGQRFWGWEGLDASPEAARFVAQHRPTESTDH